MKRQPIITPAPPSAEQDQESDARLLALIKKSGKSAKQPAAGLTQTKMTLRMDESLIDRVKEAAKAREIAMPYALWVREAIIEKLKKEGF